MDVSAAVVSLALSSEMMEMCALGPPVHIDVCPECGESSVRHMLDPPSFCTHPYELYIPVRYVPDLVQPEI